MSGFGIVVTTLMSFAMTFWFGIMIWCLFQPDPPPFDMEEFQAMWGDTVPSGDDVDWERDGF